MPEPTLTPAETAAIRERVVGLMPAVLDDLRALTRIPSVSLGSFD